MLQARKSWNFTKIFALVTQSKCGICLVNTACGGCRVFARDTVGGDPGCPEPMTPEISQLGKIGRNLDYAEYTKGRGLLSVKEYMQRYQVGQKTAVKELKKYKNTRTESLYENILDIQDTIGYTQGGAPLATFEQIEKWIEPNINSSGYPQWIKRDSQLNKENMSPIGLME